MLNNEGWTDLSSVRPTSRAAYHDTREKRMTQADRIMDYMRSGAIRTRREIGRDLDLTTSAASARVNQLVEEGRLRIAIFPVFCTVTGRKVEGVTN